MTTLVCGYCGRPWLTPPVWLGDVPYHYECLHGPGGPLRYGPRPKRELTEDDVRRIVREEMADPERQKP